MGIESRGCGPFRFQFNADGFRAVVDTVYSRRNVFDRNRLPLGLNRPAVSFVFEAVPIQGDRNDPLPSRFSSRIIPAEIRARFAREFHERACNYWLGYIANVKVKRRELVSSSP